jgi:hypothetical protein
MGSFAVRLSETAPTWGRAVAPVAEWVARTLWSTNRKACSSARARHPSHPTLEAGGEKWSIQSAGAARAKAGEYLSRLRHTRRVRATLLRVLRQNNLGRKPHRGS